MEVFYNICPCPSLFCWYTFPPYHFLTSEPVGMFYMGRCSIYTFPFWWNSSLEVEREITPPPPQRIASWSSLLLLLILSLLLSQFESIQLNCLSRFQQQTNFSPQIVFSFFHLFIGRKIAFSLSVCRCLFIIRPRKEKKISGVSLPLIYCQLWRTRQVKRRDKQIAIDPILQESIG